MSFQKRFFLSGRIWLTQWRYQSLFYFLDLAFIALFITAFIGLQMRIVEKIDSVLGLVQEELLRITGGTFSDSALIADHYDQILAANPAIAQLFGEIILAFIGLILILYLIFCLFQGATWALSNRMVHGMKRPLRYVGRFFSLNLVWFTALMCILYIWFNLTVYNMKSFIPAVSPVVLHAVMSIVLGALAYFALISYVIANEHGTWKSIRKAFSKGVEKSVDLLLMFVVLVGMMATATLITFWLFQNSFVWSVAAILLLFIPMLSFARVFAVVSVGEIVKD